MNIILDKLYDMWYGIVSAMLLMVDRPMRISDKELKAMKELKRGRMNGVETKYEEVLRKLHTCRPCDKDGLKSLLNYYYNLLN